jgi:hypothetical protein
VLVAAAVLVAFAGLLIGLPLYGSLEAAKFGETSAATAVNMPKVTLATAAADANSLPLLQSDDGLERRSSHGSSQQDTIYKWHLHRALA